jgi:2-keto-4-pentenoate hydratase
MMATGTGAMDLGNPLETVAWLANTLSEMVKPFE